MYNTRVREELSAEQLKDIAARAEIGYRMLKSAEFSALLTNWEIELEGLFDTLKRATDPHRIAQLQGQISVYEKIFDLINNS